MVEINMTGNQSLQDSFVKSLCEAKAQVSIFLINGIQLQGHIDTFDQYTVTLRGVTTQLVFKHAISTIVPTVTPSSK